MKTPRFPKTRSAHPRPPVRQRLQRGAYLLPSLFTIGNVILGFYALVRGLRGDFQAAALSIFIAGILDTLDGKIARLTGTESEFGKEFDSLADVLTFGLAPAFLAYLWGLQQYGRVGWLIPLFYLVCTATRLARFNVAIASDRRFFVGLPSPAAAGSIASLFFLVPDSHFQPWIPAVMIVALVGVGTLLVSTFRYPSFKQIDLRQRRSYRSLLLLAAFMLILAYRPPAFFLSAAVVYTLTGPLSWLVARMRRSEPEGEVDAGKLDAKEVTR